MSGHSKWATTKHKKEAADKKRGAVFTKLANAITVAARQGGRDPEMNFSLRLAIDRAKAANMPKENIERAIKRGIGQTGEGQLEEVVYEGFLPVQQAGGPNKIAIIIECLTDNKNRTLSEIKHILEKHGGSLAGQGALMWCFQKKGVIILSVASSFLAPKERSDFSGSSENNNSDLKVGATDVTDNLELKVIDAGADDIEITDNKILVYTKPEELQKVKENLEHENIDIESAEIRLVAREKVEVSGEVRDKVQKLFEELDEQPEVGGYYTNLK